VHVGRHSCLGNSRGYLSPPWSLAPPSLFLPVLEEESKSTIYIYIYIYIYISSPIQKINPKEEIIRNISEKNIDPTNEFVAHWS
jgi:hypothetical protein